MQQALRPYVTAGVALVGASMIAVTPVATQLPGLVQLSRDVQLTGVSVSDFLAGATADVDTQLQSLVDNLQTSLGDYGIALGNLATALSDPATALSNLDTAFAATTFLAGDQKTFLFDLNTGGAASLSNDNLHAILFGILTSPENPLSPGEPGILPEAVVPLVNFISSPLAGDLFGHVSPLVAPIVPFLNPFMELIADSQNSVTPDIGDLGMQLLQAPLDSIFALFNGATLNLDPLVPLIEASGLLPAAFPVTGLSYAFGGLFTPGETFDGPGSTGDGIVNGAGGSFLNALGIDTLLPFVGQGVGPIGGEAGLINAVAQALLGNLPPLQPEDGSDGPPVAGTDFLSTVFGDGDPSQLLQELLDPTGVGQLAPELAADTAFLGMI